MKTVSAEATLNDFNIYGFWYFETHARKALLLQIRNGYKKCMTSHLSFSTSRSRNTNASCSSPISFSYLRSTCELRRIQMHDRCHSLFSDWKLEPQNLESLSMAKRLCDGRMLLWILSPLPLSRVNAAASGLFYFPYTSSKAIHAHGLSSTFILATSIAGDRMLSYPSIRAFNNMWENMSPFFSEFVL